MTVNAPKRRICITGSTHGIGLAIARAFAEQGARIVLNSHLDDDRAKEALAEISALTEAHFIQADLSQPKAAETLVAKAAERLGGLDTLVNNAGTFADKPFGELTEDIFDRTFNLNVRAQIMAAQAFAAQANGDDPSIICIGSTNSMAAERNSVIYDASKGAVLMLVKSLAVTLAERGIRVNGIGPGLVFTPLTAAGLADPVRRERAGRLIPLGRVAEADDIGGSAVFLASPAARYITGQMIFVDGGILANQVSWGGVA